MGWMRQFFVMVLFPERRNIVSTQPFTGLNFPKTATPTSCMRLQGAPDARRRARRRTAVLQVPGKAADGVPCVRIRFNLGAHPVRAESFRPWCSMPPVWSSML